MRGAFHGVDLDYGALTRRNVRTVESALHEIAHAVCLGLHEMPDDLFAGVDTWDDRALTNVIAQRLAARDVSPRRRVWQEVLTLAAEVVVLKRLNLRVWNVIVRAASARGEIRSPETFDRAVTRALRWRSTQRRADITMKLLDEFCERCLTDLKAPVKERI